MECLRSLVRSILLKQLMFCSISTIFILEECFNRAQKLIAIALPNRDFLNNIF